MIEDEALDSVALKPLYIVHVKGHRGTCSIAFDCPARALKSVKDLLHHGFSEIRIANAAGQTIPLDDVQLLIEGRS